MEEKKPVKIKFKTAVILIIIAVLLLGVCAGNVYASTHGYGNIFFLIKYMITGEKPEITDRNALFSDRDITISYESIALTEDIKLQIRNLQIKDNNAKLIMVVNESKENDVTPLKYKVYNEANKLICEQKSSKDDARVTEYTEELLLNEFKNNDKILNLEIFNEKNEKLTRININIETREITIEGEKEAIKKISEVELKRFLGKITALEPYKASEDERILFADDMMAEKEELKAELNKFDAVNKMLNATGYELLPNPLKNANYFKIVNKSGTNYIEATVGRGGFEPNTVIEIKDITYCGGLYTAKFNYTYIHEPDIFNMNQDELEINEATIYFRVNEDKTYSTFKVVKFEEVTNNNSNEQLNNEIDNVKLSQIIYKALIDLQKNIETSNSGYYAKYFELGRINNNNSIDIYIWAEYGKTDNNKNVLSASSMPIKLTISIKDSLLINIDVPPDGTNYKEYFSAISDKIKNIEHKNKTSLYGNTYYEGQNELKDINNNTNNNQVRIMQEKTVDAFKSALLDKNWLKEHTLIKSANGNSKSVEEQKYKFAVIKEQDTQNPVVVLVVTAEKILTQNTFIIRYKNNSVNIEKVAEGHMEHISTMVNDNYYASISLHMRDWAYELLEVSTNDIGVVDRNRGTMGEEDYDYMEVTDFENRNSLKNVETELNEYNLSEKINNFMNQEKSTITELSPSGFAGSSLHRVELYSNKEVYLITLSDAGDRNNIASKKLIAKNVSSISKTADGDIVIKGGEKSNNTPNWIHFNP